MTTITAKIIADSVWNGRRLTTLELYYPRIIHAEVMTHRVFSRNAGSSRAIPYERARDTILSDPYSPVKWGKNQKGMQAAEEEIDPVEALAVWLEALDVVTFYADKLHAMGLHKQHVNRLLEPWAHIRVVVTATDDVWPHFFALRIHKDAQPEFDVLATAMREALANSTPAADPYHLPYVTQEEKEREDLVMGDLMLLSSARCARVSYRTHGDLLPRFEEDMGLAERLWGDPPHLSPFEHPSIAAAGPDVRHANFLGWQSYRNSKGY